MFLFPLIFQKFCERICTQRPARQLSRDKSTAQRGTVFGRSRNPARIFHLCANASRRNELSFPTAAAARATQEIIPAQPGDRRSGSLPDQRGRQEEKGRLPPSEGDAANPLRPRGRPWRYCRPHGPHDDTAAPPGRSAGHSRPHAPSADSRRDGPPARRTSHSRGESAPPHGKQPQRRSRQIAPISLGSTTRFQFIMVKSSRPGSGSWP